MSISREDALTEQRAWSAQPAWLPVLFWLDGALAGLVFFVNDWQVLLPWGWIQANPHHGHLMVELRSIVDLMIGGGMLGGLCAFCTRRVLPVWSLLTACVLLLWVAIGMAGWVSQNVFQIGCALPMGQMLWLLLTDRHRTVKNAVRFLQTPVTWNLLFFTLFVLLSTAADAVLLSHAPPSRLAAADFVLGRFVSHVYRATAIWFLLAVHDRWVPPKVRWIGWTILALTPLFLIADIILKIVWSKGLMMLFAELEVGGRFDLRRALEGGGITITPLTITFAVIAATAALTLYFTCAKFARRMHWKLSPLGFVAVGTLSWIVLQTEQGLGAMMKSRAWRWWEAKAAPMRFTPFEPEPGLASFQVKFKDAAISNDAALVPNSKSHPDIYLFIVETLRSDVLDAECAPFLSHWRDTECQPLHETFSASNATHLSWFSMLSGRLPLFWDEGRRTGQLSPMLQALRSAGYKLEVRAVSDLNYMEILRANFGAARSVDHMEFVDMNHPDHVLYAPEREIKMMTSLKDTVSRNPAGNVFRLTAFDATHYPYRWAESFTPPIKDYDQDLLFPLHPTHAQIENIRRRYRNSVAWIDRQMADFIAHLKAIGRYDDALIILTGDHGEEFQEHGNWFHCSALSPEQTHVPILIKWPHSMGRGLDISRASHLDLAPTLLDFAGYPQEAWRDLPGRSLLKAGNRSLVLATHFASRDGEGLMLRNGESVAAFGWPKIWEAGVPDRLWLERVSGMNSLPTAPSPQNYQAALQTTFPDLFGRVFSSFELKAKP